MDNVGGLSHGRAASSASFGFDDFPIFGEPLIVEFANSLYRRADESIIDYLNSAQSATAWFGCVTGAEGTALPSPCPASTVLELHQLRGAVIRVLDAVVAGGPVDNGAISTLNVFAARAPGHLELSWRNTHRSAAFTRTGLEGDIFFATLASDFVSFLAGPSVQLLRRCERPGCFMLFVQQHKTRRFCHDGCSHQMRQSRYYRSSRVEQSKAKLVRS